MQKNLIFGILGVVALALIALFLFLPKESTVEPTPPPAAPTQPAAVPSPGVSETEDTTETTEAPALAAAYETAKAFAGTYSGSWTNTTFGSTGATTATVVINADGTASFTVDLDGLVFGLLDPPPKTLAGTYDENGAAFQITGDDLFGDLTIIINRGAISFSGIDIPFSDIDAVSAEGIITPTEVNMNYTVNFPGGSLANGVLILTK